MTCIFKHQGKATKTIKNCQLTLCVPPTTRPPLSNIRGKLLKQSPRNANLLYGSLEQLKQSQRIASSLCVSRRQLKQSQRTANSLPGSLEHQKQSQRIANSLSGFLEHLKQSQRIVNSLWIPGTLDLQFHMNGYRLPREDNSTAETVISLCYSLKLWNCIDLDTHNCVTSKITCVGRLRNMHSRKLYWATSLSIWGEILWW